MGETELEAVKYFTELPQEQRQAFLAILRRFSLLRGLKSQRAPLEQRQQKE